MKPEAKHRFRAVAMSVLHSLRSYVFFHAAFRDFLSVVSVASNSDVFTAFMLVLLIGN
jgi:hypothetical protein